MIHRACISLHIPHPFKRVRRIDTTIARDYRLGFAFSALGDVAIAGPLLLSKSDFEDFPPDSSESEYTGDVDWDEEWKKVVKGENQPVARPRGNDIGEMERATRKAKREAEMQFMKIKANAKKGLNFQSLQGDWKVRQSHYQFL